MESSKLFTLLRGTWEFARAIRSASDPCFSVTGLAQFVEASSPAGAQALRYVERGTMQHEPHPAAAAAPLLPSMEVRAEHLWHFPAAATGSSSSSPAPTAHVHFADGRHFFTLALPPLAQGRSRAEFTHLCDPDTYVGSLDVEDSGGGARLQLCWRISGPKKCTEITTTLLRASQ